MRKFFTWLFDGTFSYQEYKKSYGCTKFNRKIDIFENYICQIPLFKLIGVPIATLMIVGEWLPIIIVVMWEERKDVWQSVKNLVTKGKL